MGRDTEGRRRETGDTGGTPDKHRKDTHRTNHVPSCPAHVPPCPAHHVPPMSRHVPPRRRPARVPLRFARLALQGSMMLVIFQCQSCAVGTCIQHLPTNHTRLEVERRFVMHSTFICSSTFLLLADGMPAKRGQGASVETSRVVQRVDREEETRTAASDRGEASRAERSRSPPPVAARATWRWCWMLTIQDGGEEVWWRRWWRS